MSERDGRGFSLLAITSCFRDQRIVRSLCKEEADLTLDFEQ